MVTFTVYYYKGTGERVFSHSYDETWETSDYYCPTCGGKTVWVEDTHGDYYAGPGYLCLSCKDEFNFYKTPTLDKTCEQTPQRLRNISDWITKNP